MRVFNRSKCVCVFVIWLLLLPLVVVVVAADVVQMNRTCKTMEKEKKTQQDKDREINSSKLYLTNNSLLNAYKMGKIGNIACKKKHTHTQQTATYTNRKCA